MGHRDITDGPTEYDNLMAKGVQRRYVCWVQNTHDVFRNLIRTFHEAFWYKCQGYINRMAEDIIRQKLLNPSTIRPEEPVPTIQYCLSYPCIDWAGETPNVSTGTTASIYAKFLKH